MVNAGKHSQPFTWKITKPGKCMSSGYEKNGWQGWLQKSFYSRKIWQIFKFQKKQFPEEKTAILNRTNMYQLFIVTFKVRTGHHWMQLIGAKPSRDGRHFFMQYKDNPWDRLLAKACKGASGADYTSLGGQLEASRVLREEYLIEKQRDMLVLLSLCKKFAPDPF